MRQSVSRRLTGHVAPAGSFFAETLSRLPTSGAVPGGRSGTGQLGAGKHGLARAFPEDPGCFQLRDSRKEEIRSLLRIQGPGPECSRREHLESPSGPAVQPCPLRSNHTSSSARACPTQLLPDNPGTTSVRSSLASQKGTRRSVKERVSQSGAEKSIDWKSGSLRYVSPVRRYCGPKCLRSERMERRQLALGVQQVTDDLQGR